MPSSSRKASVRRVKRSVPETYSKQYPTAGATHAYALRHIPDAIWKGVRRRAAKERLSVRHVTLRLLELYALNRVDLQ